MCYQNGFAIKHNYSDQPDSVYLFSYGTNGLRFAWSQDKQQWTSIGNGYVFLNCDYGAWKAEKKMFSPYLIQAKNNEWQVVWSLNDQTLQFAQASSNDLVTWGPQSYPYFNKGRNVLRPVISYDKSLALYTIVYADGDEKYYRTTTYDFKKYTEAETVSSLQYKNVSTTITLKNENLTGQIHRVSWKVVDELLKAYALQQHKAALNAEISKDDMQRFAGLKAVEAKLVLQPQASKTISNMLMGVFFEDINYAADGGLYAELVQNRGFEYNAYDKKYRDKNWNASYAWYLNGDKASFKIDSIKPIHPNNSHYAILEIEAAGAYLVNTGFAGIAIKKGELYQFSTFVKLLRGNIRKVEVRLVSEKQGLLAKTTINTPFTEWKAINGILNASSDATDAHLELQPLGKGSIAFDMVSLFPQKTYKQRKNGMRADLAQAIADIKPRFIRFPGGCVAHGDGIDNIYKWKNTIGPLEARKGDRNIWNYHQSMGLGFYEYFQFCQDIGAEPIPIVAAGVPCQNSSHGGGGQQGGIPMYEMGAYIKDILDLIEWANGGINTPWGKKRAEAGHPKPFNLKYIGIGNEDQITEVFRERFEMIYKAVKKAHPEITIIGTAGPFFEGTDYVEGCKIATALGVPLIDEHYYQQPGWFINNQDFYDKYDRSKSKVYLGEYAASLPGGNKTNLETALSEALYLTSLERNGDVVHMSSYAPLLAKEGHTQWNPDLIYFNNVQVKPTISYYVQQLYGQNAGDIYIPGVMSVSIATENVRNRIAYSVVKDSETEDLIVKMVNMLPVAVNAELDFDNLKIAGTKVIKTTLSGNPTDRIIQPVKSDFIASEKNKIELQPYSFSVLRFKKNN